MLLSLLTGLFLGVSANGGDPLEMSLRSRSADGGATEKKAAWDPTRTAIIVCDMWDDHWCKSAAARVGELAGPMNEMLKAARAKGIFVIHSPSTCMAPYRITPQRRRAMNAPFAPTPAPLATA